MAKENWRATSLAASRKQLLTKLDEICDEFQAILDDSDDGDENQKDLISALKDLKEAQAIIEEIL